MFSWCRPSWIVASCLALTIGLYSGCSKISGDQLSIEVSGTVTLDDSALQEGSIYFTSTKSGESAYGSINSNGQYALTIHNAEIGVEFDVTVGAPIESKEVNDPLAAPPPVRKTSAIPRRYSSRNESNLKVTFDKAEENKFDIELKSK